MLYEDIYYVVYIISLLGFALGPVYPILCPVTLTRFPNNKHAIISSTLVIVTTISEIIASEVGILYEKTGDYLCFLLILILP